MDPANHHKANPARIESVFSYDKQTRAKLEDCQRTIAEVIVTTHASTRLTHEINKKNSTFFTSYLPFRTECSVLIKSL